MSYHVSETQHQLLDQLRKLDRQEVKELFIHQSHTPDIEEMNGEYAAELLNQGHPVANWVIGKFFSAAGDWRGKAFQSTSPEGGIGYNYFMHRGEKVKRLPMLTYFDETPFAGGPSLILDYYSTSRGMVRLMRDHVRRWKEGVYLGIATVGASSRRPEGYGRKIPFVMIGPTHPFELPEDLEYVRDQTPNRRAA